MNAVAFLLALVALSQDASSAADRVARLDRACELVQQAYPMLMLAVMGEGPMDCGEPHHGVSVDCDANDTPEESARQARRLEIRQRQEAVFKDASDACDAWAADRDSTARQQAVARTFNAAREIGTDLPPEVRD